MIQSKFLCQVGRGMMCATAALLLTAAPVSRARADRHCSFARESAFYAKGLSDDALKAPAAKCTATMANALAHLQDTMRELEDCSCSYAEKPLRRWLHDSPPTGKETGAACRDSAKSINAISKTVLKEVEKCF